MPLVSSSIVRYAETESMLVNLGAELDALNAHLGGVRNYPDGGSVSARRQALAEYLGVVV